MTKPRIILLSDAPSTVRTVLSGTISLADGVTRTSEQILRTFHYPDDPFYGEFGVTAAMLDEMIRNFEADVYGQRISINLAHNDSAGAAAFFERVYRDGDRLMADLEWTPLGVEAVRDRGFRYFSAEYVESYRDPETEQKHGALLQGAALTIRPRIKNMRPTDPTRFEFAETLPGGRALHATPQARILLSEEITTMWEQLLIALAQALTGYNLAEGVIEQIKAAAAKALEGVTDEAQAKRIVEGIQDAAKELAEQIESGNGNPTITVTLQDGGGGTGLTEDAVRKILAEQREAENTEQRRLAETLTTRQTAFDAIIAADEACKALAEDAREPITEARALITADMSEDQVRTLAEHTIKMVNRISVATQLAQRGFPAPGGAIHVQQQTHADGVRLSEGISEYLRRTSEVTNGRLRAPTEMNPFTERVLAAFDTVNAAAITRELAGGETNMGDSNLPVGFQRQVIIEALHDLRVLELVQTLTDPAATVTTQVPYETRDTSDIRNSGIVYEGDPIHRSNIAQAMDTAYILAVKLAFIITNEIDHFSRASQINWDAYARNVTTCARVVRELVVARICNELQRNADAFGSISVSAEAFDGQMPTSVIKTTNYPIVRPHQRRDMQGNAVGTEDHPIVLTLNGVVLEEYDGSNTQSAGTYYRVTNYNLGYIQLVNEAGVPQSPADSGTNTISYHYATNVQKVDLDVPGGSTLEKQLNKLLQAVGARKAVMEGERYIMPDFLLMSPVLNDQATNAENFVASMQRDGADTTPSGDLARIKAIPAWSTNVPNVDLGDERILMGVRGNLTYTVAKPFMIGEPFQVVDQATNKPTGQRQAYGEEYSSVHVPAPIQNRYTSVIAYSFSSR